RPPLTRRSAPYWSALARALPGHPVFASPGSVGRRDRHSFPTRRSSDLYSVGISPPNAAAALASLQNLEAEPWRPQRAPRLGLERSEEHTSELQSLRHLVCRLLLEKKKKRAPRRRRPAR